MRHYRAVTIAILCLLGILIYSNTFQSSFHLDDRDSVFQNPTIVSLKNMGAIWATWPTRFLTYLSVAANYHFGRLNFTGYHIFNIIIHLGAGLCAWWLTLLTLSSPAIKNDGIKDRSPLIAFFVGLIFVAHPIQTQAVTYIIQRATSMAALFYLASLCLYAKARLSGKNTACYIGSLAAGVCAMFTKEMTITLPFMILLYEYTFMKEEGKKIDWKYLAPFLALIAVIPLTMIFTRSVSFKEMRLVSEPLPIYSPWQYLFTQFRVLITYMRLLFIPLGQNIDHDYPVADGFFEVPVLASLSAISIMIIASLYLFKRYRLVSFSIFWFFIALLPESSFIPIRDVTFEHRIYLATFGYALFLVTTLYYLFGQKNIRLMARILIVLTILYAALTYARNFVWKDEISLWNDAIKKSPNKSRPYDERGNAYTVKGDTDRGIEDYDKAIELNPYYSSSYNNRGVAYAVKGDLDRAIHDFTKAIEINPRFTNALSNRGNAYMAKGDTDRAIADFTATVVSNPYYAKAYNDRAIAYFLKKEYGKAWDDVRRLEALGGRPHPQFIEDLKKASGKER
ncbi:MAG: tetratricopeptide repeat protein [Candidatus Omnitrophica bacterium]|nr:tetratricopeptide repeat protein [Candidatus Omnitrophota bacterium]